MSYEILPNGNVLAPARELKTAGSYDVVVCGGGMAGFGAAVAAARKGSKVLIIEKGGGHSWSEKSYELMG